MSDLAVNWVETLPDEYFADKESRQYLNRLKEEFKIIEIGGQKHKEYYAHRNSRSLGIDVKFEHRSNIPSLGFASRRMTADEKKADQLEDNDGNVYMLDNDYKDADFQGKLFTVAETFSIVRDSMTLKSDNEDEDDDMIMADWDGNFKRVRKFYNRGCMAQVSMVSNENYQFNFDQVEFDFSEKDWFKVYVKTNPKAIGNIGKVARSGKYDSVYFNFYVPVWSKIKKGHIEGGPFFFANDFCEDELFFLQDLPVRFYPSEKFSVYFSDREISESKKELDVIEKIDESLSELSTEVKKIGSFIAIPLFIIIIILIFILWKIN